MKKRSILLGSLLIMATILSACGSGNTFEGKWVGKLDVTKQFEDGIKANYTDLAEYVDFEDLVFVLDVEFSEHDMMMSVQQESIDAFTDKFEAGMENMGREALVAYLDSMEMTMEEVVAESGMTEGQYLEHIFRQMNIEKMAESMQSVTEKSLKGLSAVRGSYTFDDNDIHLRYTDGAYESIGYEFEGKNLILTIKGDGYSLRIVCEKQ